MVRAPCCEKMGLKRGPWSPEEDQILISFIQQNGHGNWRALPKQAGLMRCGKSCRLRWINYLRPDIKRGNFTKEEEETIISLHQMLGNRWSAIAARLPGRTDNEIKNVWHTHLKKTMKNHYDDNPNSAKIRVSSPDRPESSSEMSSVTEVKKEEVDYSSEYFPPIDESFWSEESTVNRTETDGGTPPAGNCDQSGGDNVTAGIMDFWYNLLAGDMPDLPEL